MRNWTIKDAVAVIQNGKDTEAIKEIAKHFPVFFMAVAKNDLGAVAAMMTDKMTVRRLHLPQAQPSLLPSWKWTSLPEPSLQTS